MPIISKEDWITDSPNPGAVRSNIIDKAHGSQNLIVRQVALEPGSKITTHVHPNSEEAMVITEGTLDAILGDAVETVVMGQTVLAPQGIKHGFVNRSDKPAKIMAIFPTNDPGRVVVD